MSRATEFVDAAQYTETNAAFHDYLFTLTGNEHLLQAYKALGVKGRMSEVLRNATWCHPLCAQDHVDIVSAFDAGDRETGPGADRRARRPVQADHAPGDGRRAGGPAAEVHHARAGSPARSSRHRRGPGHRRADRPAYQRRRRHTGAGRPLRAGQGTRRRAGTAGPDALAVTVDLEHWQGAEALVQQALSTLRPDRRADQQRRRRHQLQTVHRVHRRRDPRRDRPLADDHAVHLPRRAAVDGGARRA